MRLCATLDGLLVLILPLAFACAAAAADANHYDQQASEHTYTSDGATVVYTPLHAWESQLDAFTAGGKVQTTRRAGASASFSFTGSSVQYICHAPTTNVMHFAVEIDGQPHDTQTVGSVDIQRQSGVLFDARGLDPTRPHTITVTNLDDKPLCVERFTYMSCLEMRCAPTRHDRDSGEQLDQQPLNIDVGQAPVRRLMRREMRQPVPPAGIVLGGAFGGAAVILAMIAVALAAMPPETPPHMQPLAAAERQQRRQQRLQNRSADAQRRRSSRSRSPMRVVSRDSDPSGSRTRQNHNRSPSQNPFLSSSQLDLDEGNPFASNGHLEVPYVAAGQASLLDLAPSSSGASTSGRSTPGTTSMLAPGRGFICAKCSVELSRERTRRQEQQNFASRGHEVQSGSRLDAGPSSSRQQHWHSHSYAEPGPSTSAGHRYPPKQREAGRPSDWT